MYRRFPILALLLVALSGIAPSWACAAMAEQHHCCPGGMPCDHDDAPQFLTDTAACCAVAPSQSQPVMSRIQKDDSTESPSSYYSPDIASFPLARPTYQSQAPPHSLRIEPHTLGRQQQLYLHTGRLRI